MLGPPCMSWPFVIGVAGVDAGVTEFWVPVSAWAACKAAWAEAFWNKKEITLKRHSENDYKQSKKNYKPNKGTSILRSPVTVINKKKTPK